MTKPRLRAALTGTLSLLTILILMAGCTGTGAGRNGAPPVNRVPRPSAAVSAAPGSEVDASRQPTSTFAIDVDTASYYYARRVILSGGRPDADTVRPEEFINAFRQDYPAPNGDGFTLTMDGARLPAEHRLGADEGELRLLRIGLQTRPEDAELRPDAALTFVIDVSGSMSEPGRLDLVQDALHYLIDQLRDTDRVAIVTYDTRARVVREMTEVRSRSVLHGAIDRLEADGSTNLEAGLVTGFEVAREGFVPGATNRVILLSDGLANVGNTSAEPILRQVREEAAKKISLLGVGVGSDYGDALMEQLADNGDGFVVYISERSQARRLFVQHLPAALSLRALDAKVQVTFDPKAVESYRLIGYDNRVLDNADFRDDRVDGGEVGPGHSVTALYLVRLHAEAPEFLNVAQARVRWLDPATREPSETSGSIDVVRLDVGFGAASPRLQVCYVAAYFAEILRASRYADQVRLGDLASRADTAFDATDDAQVGELADLIRRTRD